MALDLLLVVGTVANSIAQIAVFCIVGYVAALKGVIDIKSRRQLNRLNLGVFTPALVFGKIAFSLTPTKLFHLWVVPVGFVLVTGVSWLSAYILGRMFGLSQRNRNLILAGAMFMNTNTIPIALMHSLSNSLAQLKWGPLDTPDKELGRAFSYLAIYSLLGSVLRWSFGIRLFNEVTAEDTTESYEKVSAEMHSDNLSRPTHGASDISMPAGPNISCAQSPEAEDTIKGRVRFSSATTLGNEFVPVDLGTAYTDSSGTHTLKGGSRFSSATAFSSQSGSTGNIAFYPSHTTESKTSDEGFQTGLHDSQSGALLGIYEIGIPQVVSEDCIGQATEKNPPECIEQPQHETPTRLTEFGKKLQDSSQSSAFHGHQEIQIPHVISEDHNGRGSNDFFPENTENPYHQALTRLTVFWTSLSSSKLLYIPKKIILRVQKFLNPPLISSVLAILIACILPLQKWLASIHLLRSFLDTAGNVSIPLTLVVLGSFFHQRGNKVEKSNVVEVCTSRPEGDPSKRIHPREETMTIVLTLFARHLMAPLILLPLLYVLAWHSNIALIDDPIFLMTFVLLIGAPPAITLAQMTTRTSSEFDTLVSRLLLWSFTVITPITTMVLVGISMAMHNT